jgi:ribosomal protein L37AE/L43A
MGGKHECPVCGKYSFEEDNSLDICDRCGWQDDAVQVKNPDYTGGANMMSLNQAKEAYRQGKHIE